MSGSICSNSPVTRLRVLANHQITKQAFADAVAHSPRQAHSRHPAQDRRQRGTRGGIHLAAHRETELAYVDKGYRGMPQTRAASSSQAKNVLMMTRSKHLLGAYVALARSD